MTDHSNVQISFQDQPDGGRYVARIEGVADEGELTFTRVSDRKIVADHTFVPEAMRGTGAASALVDRLIEDARAKGQRIVPACSYVRSQAQRHPEWSDVIES